MPLDTIQDSLFGRLEATAGLPQIFFDNVKVGTPNLDHLRPYVLPATTRTIGLNTLSQEIGVFQVSIFVKKGTGVNIGPIIGQLILDAFPRNLELPGLRIDKVGTINVPFYKGDYQITPVSIDYQELSS